MSTYTLDEGCLFEKSGDSYIIEGIRFTTAYGEVYCAAGIITPLNCNDASGNLINTKDVTEAEAKGHLEWMASDFESRGCGVADATVVEKLVAYTNKGPILVPLTDATTTEVTVDEGKNEVNVDSVVSVVSDVVAKAEAAKAEALAAEVVAEEVVKA